MIIKQDIGEDVNSVQENSIELTESGYVYITLSSLEYKIRKSVNKKSTC